MFIRPETGQVRHENIFKTMGKFIHTGAQSEARHGVHVCCLYGQWYSNSVKKGYKKMLGETLHTNHVKMWFN